MSSGCSVPWHLASYTRLSRSWAGMKTVQRCAVILVEIFRDMQFWASNRIYIRCARRIGMHLELFWDTVAGDC